jgi:hypothetical protein
VVVVVVEEEVVDDARVSGRGAGGGEEAMGVPGEARIQRPFTTHHGPLERPDNEEELSEEDAAETNDTFEVVVRCGMNERGRPVESTRGTCERVRRRMRVRALGEPTPDSVAG